MLRLAIISLVLSANAIASGACTPDDISYDDLKQLNVSCHPKDTCSGREPDDSPGIPYPKACSCHADCSLFGTCCIDSPHRGGGPPTNQKCGVADFPQTFLMPTGYYMVQSCPENKAVWKHLCEGGLDKDGDVLRIAPVTSLDTNTTYRNYYCFRCNELTDNFLYWNLNLLTSKNLPVTDDFKVTYNDTDNTWSATSVDEGVSVTVKLQFLIPPEIRFPVIGCNPKVVTDCPDSWEDDVIRSKCDSYTALLYKSFGPVYKNAHCALCNSQPLHDLSCEMPRLIVKVKAFSFAHLIDINRSDGDEVGKKVKCEEGRLWDPYGKKCRKLSCALPGYVIKDGKCVAP